MGLTLALALAQGGLKVIVADPVPPRIALDAGVRRAGERALLFLGADASRRWACGTIWKPMRNPSTTFSSPMRRSAARLRRSRCISIPPRSASRWAISRRTGISAARCLQVSTQPEIFVIAAGRTHRSRNMYQMEFWPNFPNGDTVHAKLAVAADGRESPMREQMGLGVISWAYPQWGIVATVEHEHPHDGTAYEHFLPSGPFAILPMTGNRSSLVWTEREDVAPAMMKLPDDEFDAEIARRFGSHLGATKAAGPRWSYPLQFHLARVLREAAFCAGGRCGTRHSSDCGAGPQSRLQGCGRAGRSGARCRAARPRYRRHRYAEAL